MRNRYGIPPHSHSSAKSIRRTILRATSTRSHGILVQEELCTLERRTPTSSTSTLVIPISLDLFRRRTEGRLQKDKRQTRIRRQRKTPPSKRFARAGSSRIPSSTPELLLRTFTRPLPPHPLLSSSRRRLVDPRLPTRSPYPKRLSFLMTMLSAVRTTGTSTA